MSARAVAAGEGKRPEPRGVHDLPPQVQLVWHGVNDLENLRESQSAPVAWVECDVRLGRGGGCVLHHDAIPPGADEDELMPLSSLARSVAEAGRSLKLDVKERSALGALARVLADVDLPDDRLWFNARRQVLGPDDFAALRSAHPGAILQCPVDDVPVRDLGVVTAGLMLAGVNRFSVAWGHPSTEAAAARLSGAGRDVNLYGIADRRAFVDAVLFGPASVTADFNFPDWAYYGTGSGEGGRRHPSRAQLLATA